MYPISSTVIVHISSGSPLPFRTLSGKNTSGILLTKDMLGDSWGLIDFHSIVEASGNRRRQLLRLASEALPSSPGQETRTGQACAAQ